MSMHWAMVVAWLCSVLPVAAVVADAQDRWQPITLITVQNITQATRQQAQVRGGIPLSIGQARDASLLTLQDDRGNEVPASFRTLARWPDGSIKWVLLDTLADVPALGSRSFTLGLRDQPSASGPLLAQETDARLILPFKQGRLVFHKTPHPGPLWQLELQQADGQWQPLPDSADSELVLQTTPPGEPDPEGSWIRQASDDAGLRFLATLDAQRSVTLEENGPYHAIVRIDGWHVLQTGRRVFPYSLRIHAHRDSSQLRMAYTFIVTEDPASHFVRSLRLTLPGVLQPTQAIAGLPDAKNQAIPLASATDLLSIRNLSANPRHYDRISYKQANPVLAILTHRDATGEHETQAGVDAPGWLMLANDRRSASVGFRDFARMHPKELAGDGAGNLHVYLWPERGNSVLDLRRRSAEIRREFVENDADPFGGRGIALTHEWFVAYEPIDGSSDALIQRTQQAAAMAQGASQPLRPIAPPAYVAQTRAFGEFLPAGLPQFDRMDQALAFSVRYLRKLRHAFELDGMIDWGDVPIAGVGAANHLGESHPEGIPFRGYNGWLNNDWGLAHGLFLHYLRTGDPHTLLDAENMARHVMDVDTIHHYPENPAYVGQGRRHDQQHWGNGPRDYCFAPYATIDHYLLTGEGRAYEVAQLMADNPVGYGRYSTLRFWEISGDDAYLHKAKELLKQDLQGSKDGWPFVMGQNFRSNSYDGIGYTFFDSIAPSHELTAAATRSLDLKREAWLTPWMNPGHPAHLLAALAHRANPSPENTQALKAMTWSVTQGKLDGPDTSFNLPDDADFEAYLQTNRQTLNLGRTDMHALYYLIGLPRVMARLHATGVDEQACFHLQWEWKDRPSFAETLDNQRIRKVGQDRPGFDHEYDYYTAHASPGYRPDARFGPEVMRHWQAATGRTRLYENGVLIGPAGWPRAQMREHGLIGWTRRLSNAIAFTTPDNSDPRTNGRTYTLVYTSADDERWQEVASFDETFTSDRIMPFGPTGRVWAYRLTSALPQLPSIYPQRKEDTAAWTASLSCHAFFIDGQSQGDIHPEENWGVFWRARASGWGRCENLILFVLPEGVDPRTDGRTYSFRYTAGPSATLLEQR